MERRFVRKTGRLRMVSFRESRLSSQLETFTLSSRLDSGSSAGDRVSQRRLARPDIGPLEIPQCSTLLPWCHVLSFRQHRWAARSPPRFRTISGLTAGPLSPLGHAASSWLLPQYLEH